MASQVSLDRLPILSYRRMKSRSRYTTRSCEQTKSQDSGYLASSTGLYAGLYGNSVYEKATSRQLGE